MKNLKNRAMAPVPIADTGKLTVFYDGACPLCEREISFYRQREGADSVVWVDVSRFPEGEVAPSLSKDQALTRFHVLNADGALISGGAAFAELWTVLPSFRLWGKLFQVRPFVWVLNRVYDRFLRIRPRIQSIVAGRQTLRDGTFPSWLIRDLRSNHAGETGAVAIYQGILAVARRSDIRRFAEAHLKTERRHLELIETALPRKSRSVFLPLWHVAGFLTGAVPALLGRKAVFATVDAVETFVEGHYVRQIDRLSRHRTQAELRAVLERCRLDERRHRDEARYRLTHRRGIILRAWCWMVGAGSSAAVAMARVL